MGNLVEAQGEDRVREALEWAIFLRENFRNRARAWDLPEWRIEQIIRETDHNHS